MLQNRCRFVAKHRVSVLLLFCQFSVDPALDRRHCKCGHYTRRSSHSRMVMDGKQVAANGMSRRMQAQGQDKRDTLYLKYVHVSWLRNPMTVFESAYKASSIHCAGEYQNGSFDATVNSASSRRGDAMLLSTQNCGMCSQSL
jgi:hypothetical protein